MIEPRAAVKNVRRIGDRVEDRRQFVCLDKNERVDPLPDAVMQEILFRFSPYDLTQYPALEPFYEELASWLKVPRNWLLLTNGSDQGIRQVYEVYASPGDVGLLLSPTFAMFDVYARLFQLKPRCLTYDNDFRLPVEQVIQELTGEVRLLLLANPNSPTGTAFSVQELQQIVEAAAGSRTMVLIDEAYYYFYDQTALELVGRYDNVIVSRTFSKAGGLAGARLGFLVSQPQNMDFLSRVKPMYEINGLAMRLGEYLIHHDKLLWDYADSSNAGRAYLASVFERLGLRVFPGHANFLVARPPATVDIRSLVATLRERGYLIRGPFGDAPLKDCLRVTTASVETMTSFAKVFTEIYQAQATS